MLDSIRLLFITGEDIDGPTVAKDQDGEQDINDDEKDASDAHCSNNSHTPSDPAASRAASLLTKKKPSNGNLTPNTTTPNPPIQTSTLLFYSEKKTEIADQIALDRAEFEGIVDTDRYSRNLIEGYKPG